MNRIAKLLVASTLGLAVVQASAASSVFAFSEDAYNSQFSAEAQSAAKAAAPTLPKQRDTKAVFAFSEDAYNSQFENAGNQDEQIVIKAKAAPRQVAGGSANIKVANLAKASDEPWYSTNP